MMQLVEGSERSVGDKVKITSFSKASYVGKEGYIGYSPIGRLCVIVNGMIVKGESFYKCIDLTECDTEIIEQGPFYYNPSKPLSYEIDGVVYPSENVEKLKELADSNNELKHQLELIKFLLNTSSEENNSSDYKVEILKDFFNKKGE